MRADTICALCTPKGKGAISLIRVSGPKALEITRKLAAFLPLKPQSHRAYLGVLKKDREALDQVLVTYFAEGRSFTGEESLEISCHGGEIYSEILKALLDSGARLAEQGEFSLRAFSNGKMDLIQVEGLLQLIESQSEVARKQAFFQLRGDLSKKIRQIEKRWIFLLSHLEADIDFSLEGLNTLDEKQITKSLEELQFELSSLLSRYRPFEKLQKGLIFGIFGRTNAGKSSLFNALLGEDKAIISKEEGTTRDLVEGLIFNPEGLSICLKDSAGFRLSESEGDLKGQEKSKELFFYCDYRIIVLDSVHFAKEGLEEFLFKQPDQTFLVFTKKDLVKKQTTKKDLLVLLKKQQSAILFPPENQTFFVSSLSQEGISALRKKILSYGEIRQEDFLISNYRHYKGLKVMEESLKNCQSVLKNSQGERDIMALELRQGLLALYEILGQQIDDQILDRIFKEFCIGK